MKKISIALAAIMLLSLLAGCAAIPDNAPAEEAAEDDTPLYYYCTADDLKEKLESGVEMVIVDIQPEEYYRQAHLPGSIPTGAYPADTDELRSMLDVAMDSITATTAPVIIIGMGGKTGAVNAAKYYSAKGVPAERLFILEGGSISWPYDELMRYEIDYQYMTPDELVKRLDEKQGVMMIDVRPEENYNAGYLPGAVFTGTYPNNTREQWDKLSELKADVAATLDPVVRQVELPGGTSVLFSDRRGRKTPSATLPPRAWMSASSTYWRAAETTGPIPKCWMLFPNISTLSPPT